MTILALVGTDALVGLIGAGLAGITITVLTRSTRDLARTACPAPSTTSAAS